MKIVKEKQSTIFYPEGRNSSRIKILFAFRSLLAGVVAVAGLLGLGGIVEKGQPLSAGGIVAVCAATAGLLFMLLVAIRFALKIYDKEYITVSPGLLTINERKMLKTTAARYDFAHIDYLSYMGYTPTATHQLEGNTSDYMGFGARASEIARVHDDGNLSFWYKHKTVHFGRDVSSWDSQKISDALSAATDGRLTILGLPEEMHEDIYMSGNRQTL